MKKSRILSLILAIVLVFSVVTTTAHAALGADDKAGLLDGYKELVTYDGKDWSTGSFSDSVLTPGYNRQGGNDKNINYSTTEGRNYVIAVDHFSGDYYLNINLSSSYINASTVANENTYANAYKLFTEYAGKSFAVTADFKLNALLADESDSLYTRHHILSQVLTTWTVPNTANPSSSTAFFTKFTGVNNATGEIVYYKVGTDGDNADNVVKTGIYLTTDEYKTVTTIADPMLNSYSVYVDGVYVGSGTMMSQTYINRIARDSGGDINNRGEIDVTDLTTEEANAKRLANYTPFTFRFFQEAGLTYKADNLGVYVSEKSTVKGHSLTIDGGTLGLNYFLDLDAEVLADTNATVRFTTPRGTQETLVKDVVAETDGSYKFTAKVSSVEMASAIKMEIVSGERVYRIYKNGTASAAYEYSVKEYADQVIAGEYAEAMKNVAKAMLNYGAAAQVYFGFNTEKLASENYTEALAQVTSNDISAVAITGTAPTGTKAALILDSDTSIVIYNAQGEKIGDKTGINSKNLDAPYEITCEGGTVTVSVLAIGEKVLESGTASAEYKNLVKALKLFSDASKAV